MAADTVVEPPAAEVPRHGTIERLRGHTRDAGDLLAIDDVFEDGMFVRSDGTLVKQLQIGSLNPWVMDAKGSKKVIEAIGKSMARLPTGASVQFVCEARPMPLGEIVQLSRQRTGMAVMARAEDDRTAHLADAPGDEDGAEQVARDRAYRLARLEVAAEETMAMHATQDGAVHYRYLLVLTYRPPAPVMQLRPRPRTIAEHDRAARTLRARCDKVRAELQAAKIDAREQTYTDTMGELWLACNPSSATAVVPGGMPAPSPHGTVRWPLQARDRARELRGWLAGSRIREDDGGVFVGEDLHMSIAVARKPQAMTTAWMLPAWQVGKPFRFAVHLTARDARKERARLKRAHDLLHSVRNERRMKGRPTNFTDNEHNRELTEVQQRVSSGEQLGFFDVAITLTLRETGPDANREDLRHAVDQAADALTSSTSAVITRLEGNQLPAWQTTLPIGVDALGIRGYYTSDVVGAAAPVWGGECGSPHGLPIFYTAGRAIANCDPLDPEASNYLTCVYGAQGAGKSVLVNALRRGLQGWGACGYVVDRADHHVPLSKAMGGLHAKLGASDNSHRINPWDVYDLHRVDDEQITAMVDLHAALIGARGAGYGLTAAEEGVIETAVRETYDIARREGRMPERTESVFKARLEQRANEELQAGAVDRAGMLRELASRLEPFVGEGSRAWLVDRPTTVPKGGVAEVVIDTRAVPESLQGAVQMIATRHILSHAQALEKRKENELEDWERRFAQAGLNPDYAQYLFAIYAAYDEVWSQMEREATGRRFADLGRRSRHHGLIVIAATQRLQDFDTPWGRALLSSATQHFALAQNPNDYPVLKQLAGFSDHEIELIDRHVATTNGREARAYWINGKRGRGIVSLRMGPQAYWAATTHPKERPRRDRAIREAGGDVWAGIDRLLGNDHPQLQQVA